MTILDELAELARAQRAGTSDLPPLALPLCRVSKIPIDWCSGCKKGHHRRAVLEHSLREGVDEARADSPPPWTCPRCQHWNERGEKVCGGCGECEWAPLRDPDFCPRCTPLYGACRCEIAASE